MARQTSFACFCLVTLSLCCGCGQGVNVTQASLKAAEAKWAKAGIKDYDLDWRSSGARPAEYRVFVRGGEVKAIYALYQGKEIVAKPGQPRFYGVDGLFLTIAEDLAQMDGEMPFGKPKGTPVVMRFEADSVLGYPRIYVRDVSGTPQGVTIEVIRLEKAAGEEIPPPRTTL